MSFTKILTFLLISVISACSSNQKHATFAEKIEKAHQKSQLSGKVFVFDLDLTLGPKTMDVTITANPDLSQIKMVSDSVTVLYNGKEVIQYPDSVNYMSARFDIFTWPYFFALPYKLNDPGTQWTDFPDATLDGQAYNIKKLSFEPGTGDSPDDWYIVYANQATKRLHAAAYIVTYGKSVEEAEKQPHAIVYKNYKTIDGIPVATSWDFTMWDDENHFGEVIGNSVISNIKIKDSKPDMFEAVKSVNTKTIPEP